MSNHVLDTKTLLCGRIRHSKGERWIKVRVFQSKFSRCRCKTVEVNTLIVELGKIRGENM